MRVRTTSTQRTYRYVRMSLIAVMLFLAVGIGAQIVLGGPLPSVSAAYHTPARDVFVGALSAVAVAMLVLSGRSVEQFLLDLAALFAAVVAFVPSALEPGTAAAVTPSIEVSMTALLTTGVAGVVVAFAVLRRRGGVGRTAIGALLAAALVIAGMGAWWLRHPESFTAAAHDAAATAFFVLIAVVAALAARRPIGAHRAPWLRATYTAIAVGIVVALLVVVAAVASRAAGVGDGTPWVFLGEAAALALFTLFWTVQTVELWDVADPENRAGITSTSPR